MRVWFYQRATWLIAITLCGLVYVAGFAWSPSSYGLVLEQIGVTGQGPTVGRPRTIRSDEWAVVTPLTQAAVRNGFERINKASVYEEDLRINYGLPLADWGALFKPTLWGFFVLDAASAYSLHWFATMAMFLVGHALLFMRLGLAPVAAGLLGVALYFTGFTQFWWNEKGPVLAFFPWVVLTLLSRRLPLAAQLLSFYWLTASWLMTNLYPPVQVSLGFVGGLLVVGWAPAWMQPRRLALLAFASIASAATAALYLKDYLRATAATIYPGSRTSGGGAVPWQEALSYVFPFSTFDGRYESVAGSNICEVGTGATALVLLVGCFLDYRSLGPAWHRASTAQRRQFQLLGLGLLLMAIWMMVPLPSWAGFPLLWNHVDGERMEYAFGVALALALGLVVQKAELVCSARRMAVLVALVWAGWVLVKAPAVDSLRVKSFNDLLVLVAALPAWWAWRHRQLDGATALMAAAALAGLLAVWGFNPLQGARPIFARHDTPLLRELAQQQERNGGVLATGGMFGAVQNGLGFHSVAHVNAVPAFDFWRNRFPDMSEQSLMSVFNRYAHIVLSDEDQPRVLYPDRIAVPVAVFQPHHLLLPIEGPALQDAPVAIPVWLSPGARAHGSATVPRAGKLRSFALSIGNGQGHSDGELVLQVCNDSECVQARRGLQGSRDNAYFDMPLPQTLAFAVDERLHFTLQLQGASRPMALWAYPLAQGAISMDALTIGGRPQERWLPRLDLTFTADRTP